MNMSSFFDFVLAFLSLLLVPDLKSPAEAPQWMERVSVKAVAAIALLSTFLMEQIVNTSTEIALLKTMKDIVLVLLSLVMAVAGAILAVFVHYSTRMFPITRWIDAISIVIAVVFTALSLCTMIKSGRNRPAEDHDSRSDSDQEREKSS